MRIVSFGDLYLDYYFKNSRLIGVGGGSSNANILANLASNYATLFIGTAGNDTAGSLAIKSLEKLNVEVAVTRVPAHTKVLFWADGKFSLTCPYCHRSLAYDDIKWHSADVVKLMQPDDVLVVDNVNTETLKVLAEVNNPVFMMINYLGPMLYMSLEEIIMHLAHRSTILWLNEKVYQIFKRKFGLDSTDVYNYLQPKILIINRGLNGYDIIYNGEFTKKERVISHTIVDATGVDDAFFATFIRTYLVSGEVSEKMISEAYIRSSVVANTVASLLGARTHLEPLYQILEYRPCICEEFTYK